MEQDRTVLPFQALTLRERVIAELSFPLLDKGTDAVTIGDVRQIADRIVALIAEQSKCSVTDEMVAVALNEYHHRSGSERRDISFEFQRQNYPDLVDGMRRALEAALGTQQAEDEPQDVLLRHRCRVLLSTLREPTATEFERESAMKQIEEIVNGREIK